MKDGTTAWRYCMTQGTLSIRSISIALVVFLAAGLLTTAFANKAEAACSFGYAVGTPYKWSGKVRADVQVSLSRGCSGSKGYVFRLVKKENIWPTLDIDSGDVYPGQTIYIPLVGTCSSGTHTYMAYLSYPWYEPGASRKLTC
jgi:hypothetical protein